MDREPFAEDYEGLELHQIAGGWHTEQEHRASVSRRSERARHGRNRARGVHHDIVGVVLQLAQIGGHDIEALSFAESPRPEDLAREVAGLGSDAVNILNSSSLSLEHLVEVVDALREAGVERVAIPGRPPVREPEEPR